MQTESGIAVVYVTVASPQEAEKIGAELLEERLAACVNILPGMISSYWWQGKLERSPETAMLIKTKRSLAGPVVDKVKSLHSYECPCILILPVDGGNPAFMQWVAETVRE